MSTDSSSIDSPAAAEPRVRPAPPAQRNSDVLGLGWLHGRLCAAVFHRQKMTGSWTGSAPVQTMEELAAALDEALATLAFAGTEVFLLLESDQFAHQTESAPALSDSAARTYLQSRVKRQTKEQETTLWVSQETLPIKQERSFILHLLPGRFYDELNKILLERRLDLTRILPMSVPLQRELDRFPISKGKPVLVAVEAGGATIVMVALVGGRMVFARTILAAWGADPARIGVEINRSVLYAKQQFGTAVERIWLLGERNDATAEVNAKCGTGKQIMVLPTTPVEWLQSVAKLSPRHPVNLVAGYLKQKRRSRLVRRLLIAAAWLGLGFVGFNSWTQEQEWTGERRRLAALRIQEPAMTAERERLVLRNHAFEKERAFLRQVEEDRLPPVPGRFLAFLAGVLPGEMRLTDFTVKWDETAANWSFRIEGAIETDEETAREVLDTLQKRLNQSPLRARFGAAGRALVAMPATAGASAPDTQRFSLEGVMLEN